MLTTIDQLIDYVEDNTFPPFLVSDLSPSALLAFYVGSMLSWIRRQTPGQEDTAPIAGIEGTVLAAIQLIFSQPDMQDIFEFDENEVRFRSTCDIAQRAAIINYVAGNYHLVPHIYYRRT